MHRSYPGWGVVLLTLVAGTAIGTVGTSAPQEPSWKGSIIDVSVSGHPGIWEVLVDAGNGKVLAREHEGATGPE